jgi:hypothetical protein
MFVRLPTKPGYVHEGPWPYPNTDKRREYMRNYMREREEERRGGVRAHHEPMSPDELREYKRNRMRVYRKRPGYRASPRQITDERREYMKNYLREWRTRQS